jgi:hypothetical protein
LKTIFVFVLLTTRLRKKETVVTSSPAIGREHTSIDLLATTSKPLLHNSPQPTPSLLSTPAAVSR